jgi:hypothetical protein
VIRRTQRRGHQQRATEDWALERDNGPMPGRASDTPLVGSTAELVLDDALGAAVGGRRTIAVLRVEPASGRAGSPRRRPPKRK